MRKEALVNMGLATSSTLSIEQLRALANDPLATLDHLEAVLRSLSAGDEEVVSWANEALENCGQPPSSALSLLQSMIVANDANVATWACKLAARLEVLAAPAQVQLAAALQSGNPTLLREEAARALGLIGALEPSTMNLLEQAAKDGSPRLKRIATAALGR